MELEVENDNVVDSEIEKLDTSKVLQDPFAYLNRNHFTSEKFKIEVRGLPKFYGLKEFKTFLNEKLHLNCVKIKPPKHRSHWMYVCFRSEEDRQNALKEINGCLWKNKRLSASVSSAVPDPLVKRRNEKLLTEEAVSSEEVNKPLQIKSNIVPLHNVNYVDQLKVKQDIVISVFKSLGKKLSTFHRHNISITQHLMRQMNRYDGLPCKLDFIIESPTKEGYRNKCEFSIGIDEETKKRTIGFRVASYAKGTTSVCPIHDMPHVPQRMKEVVQVFQGFVEKSKLDVYNNEHHTGYWKQLTVRLGTRTNQIMVIVCMHRQNLTDEELMDIKKEITEFFTDGDGKICNVSSLYIEYARKSSEGAQQPPCLKHLYGSSAIVERLFDLDYSIPPTSFFQINTSACEYLYSKVRELAELTPYTIVLDICCGIGTIGIYLSKFCKHVVGIESDAIAVKQAEYNTKQNSISNCSFHHGKAEDVIPSVLSEYEDENIVAILDPPRAGLHHRGIILLRNALNINKIVYLSCNPKAASQNFENLGKPHSKTLFGKPFLPSKAVPVDMFPYTKHCELVLAFDRFKDAV